MLCIITFFHKTRKNLRQEYYVQSHPIHTKGLINYIDNLRKHLEKPYRRGEVMVDFIMFMPKVHNNKVKGDYSMSFNYIYGHCMRKTYYYAVNAKNNYVIEKEV